jgi:hypothetical protein
VAAGGGQWNFYTHRDSQRRLGKWRLPPGCLSSVVDRLPGPAKGAALIDTTEKGPIKQRILTERFERAVLVTPELDVYPAIGACVQSLNTPA